MGKKVGVWLLSFVLMLPCCMIVLPLVGFWVMTFVQAQMMARRLGGSVTVTPGYRIEGMANLGYVFMVAIFVLFIAGFVLLVRNLRTNENEEA